MLTDLQHQPQRQLGVPAWRAGTPSGSLEFVVPACGDPEVFCPVEVRDGCAASVQ